MLGDCCGWMGERCGSWFPQQQFDWKLPYSNYSSAPILSGQNCIPTIMNLGTNNVPTNGKLPVNAYPVQPHSQAAEAIEPHGWFYCLPRFRQAFMPASLSILKEQLPAAPFVNHGETTKTKAGSGCAQKRFLVFDQSGDQTTFMFSSGIGNPVQCLTSWSPKPLGRYNLSPEIQGAKAGTNVLSMPNLIDDLDETNGADLQSEMHEDTEELNALLYSDDDGDYTDDDEDDEVTSTGHSPSTMTAHEKQDWFDGSTEEVASSAGPIKKRKLFDGVYDDVPLPVPSSSVKCNLHLDDEDDAESSCANSQNPGSDEFGSVSTNKRLRKEKIRETVSVLRSIIPDGEGKDAMLVLDEAIDYLKSLRLKAKALGLDSL